MVNGKLILNLTEPYIEAMILSNIAKKIVNGDCPNDASSLNCIILLFSHLTSMECKWSANQDFCSNKKKKNLVELIQTTLETLSVANGGIYIESQIMSKIDFVLIL